MVFAGLLAGFAAVAASAAWTPAPSLPEAYYGHALVEARGFLYHVGGMGGVNGAAAADRVFAAHIENGAIGAWRSVRPLPEYVFFHAAVSTQDKLIVLGGYHANDQGLNVSNVVYVADVGADGELSEWRRGPDLPEPVFYPSAAAWNGSIYLTGGWNGASLSNGVHSSKLEGGALGAWQPRTALPEGVYTHAAVSNGVLYVLGGVVNNGTEIQSAVMSSPIAADGSIGAWSPTTPLLQPLSNHGASFANGRVIVTGGWNGSAPTAEASNAIATSGGGLAEWELLDPLPSAIYLHGQAAAGGRLWVSGGTDGATPTAQVWSAPLPSAPDQLPPRTSLAVGTPSVGAIVSPLTPLSLTAVDDLAVVGDGVGSGVQESLIAVGSGELATYREAVRVPTDGRHVLRFLSVDLMGRREAERQSEVVVDGSAPVSTISPARELLGATDSISLSASDAGAGVLGLEAGVDGAQAGAYEAAFALPEGAHTVTYRAADRVGNVEAWRTASFRVDLTAPQSTLSVNGAVATLSAVDPEAAGVSAGVDRIVYSLDGGADQVYSSPLTVAAGQHTLSFYSADAAGNAEDRRSETFTYTPPPAPGPSTGDAVAAVESIVLDAGAKVKGDARSPVVTLSGGSSITGAKILSAPELTVDLAAARAKAKAGTKLGKVKLDGSERLTLAAGDYYADEIKMSGLSSLKVTGKVTLFVEGDVKVTGLAQLNASENTDELSIISAGGKFELKGFSLASFNLYAPAAQIEAQGVGRVAGRLLGRRAAISGMSIEPGSTGGPLVFGPKALKKLLQIAAHWAKHHDLELPKVSGPEGRKGGRLASRRKNFSPRMPMPDKAVMALVPKDGGQVRGAERAAVEIPAEAAPAALAVTVKPAETPEAAKEVLVDKEPAGKAVEFGPHGTRFNKPVTIELPFEVWHPGLVAHYWNDQRREWEPLPSVIDREAKVVRAQTTHFSLYQVLAPAGASAGADGARLGEVFAFPNPARPGQTPTIRVNAENIDGVELKVFDVSGQLVHQAGFSGARAQYDFPVSGLGSGVYIWSVKSGGISRRGRMAVIR